MNWKTRSFDELTTRELYNILKLRNEVFVVEQDCVYLDTDDIDQESFHVFLENEGQVVAYARAIPYGIKGEYRSLGRVIVKESVRREGVGSQLIEKTIGCIEEQFGKGEIVIHAQAHLVKFYSNFDFKCASEEFLEDGIPHVKMVRNC